MTKKEIKTKLVTLAQIIQAVMPGRVARRETSYNGLVLYFRSPPTTAERTTIAELAFEMAPHLGIQLVTVQDPTVLVVAPQESTWTARR